MVADLLEPGDQAEDQPPPGKPLGSGDRGHRLVDDGPIQRGLFDREGHDLVGLGLGWQVGSDVLVGLAPAEQERPQQLVEPLGLDGITVAFDGDRDLAAESLERPQQAGCGPVEDGPEIGELVLDRGPRERQAGGVAADRPHGSCGVGVGILDRLGLVGDDQTPSDGGQSGSIAPGHPVGRQHDVPGLEARFGQRSCRPVIANDAGPGSEAVYLSFPVADNRGRADHQHRSMTGLVTGGLPGQVEGEHLNGLAQAHVVGEDAAEAQPVHLVEPGQPPFLVGAEGAVEPVGCPKRLDALDRAQPVGQITQRGHPRDVDAVTLDHEFGAEGGGDRGGRRDGPPFTEPLDRTIVELDPLAPKPDQRSFRPGQFDEFGFGELFAVECALPAELEQGAQIESRRGQRRRRTDQDRTERERGEQVGRGEYRQADRTQSVGHRPEELVDVVVVEQEFARSIGLEESVDRRPDLGCPSQCRDEFGLGALEAFPDSGRRLPQG